MSDPQIMIAKPRKYLQSHKIMNLHNKCVIQKVMVKHCNPKNVIESSTWSINIMMVEAMKYWEFHHVWTQKIIKVQVCHCTYEHSKKGNKKERRKYMYIYIYIIRPTNIFILGDPRSAATAHLCLQCCCGCKENTNLQRKQEFKTFAFVTSL